MSDLCPSCREPLDYPSGDGCAAMTKHKVSDMMITVDLKTFEEMSDKIIDTEDTIRELFALLDITEQTDDGRYFRPNVIHSRRALDAEKLEQVLRKLKKWV
jgi:phage gp29-like protein